MGNGNARKGKLLNIKKRMGSIGVSDVLGKPKLINSIPKPPALPVRI